MREFRPRPATKSCGICENLIGHSVIEDGRRVRLPATRCEHKGRGYMLNGFLYMRLCACCVNGMRKRAPGMSVKEAV